eukprot:768031-Hanusia_phi.AAC.6
MPSQLEPSRAQASTPSSVDRQSWLLSTVPLRPLLVTKHRKLVLHFALSCNAQGQAPDGNGGHHTHQPAVAAIVVVHTCCYRRPTALKILEGARTESGVWQADKPLSGYARRAQPHRPAAVVLQVVSCVAKSLGERIQLRGALCQRLKRQVCFQLALRTEFGLVVPFAAAGRHRHGALVAPESLWQALPARVVSTHDAAKTSCCVDPAWKSWRRAFRQCVSQEDRTQHQGQGEEDRRRQDGSSCVFDSP